MNLLSTSAGLVLIGVCTLTITRRAEEPGAGEPPTAIVLGICDAPVAERALAALEASADPELARELARVAQEGPRAAEVRLLEG
jgi:hypothetical protein